MKCSNENDQKDDERPGLRCPNCNCADLRVYYTRQSTDRILRVRICRYCGRKITTYERIR